MFCPPTNTQTGVHEGKNGSNFDSKASIPNDMSRHDNETEKRTKFPMQAVTVEYANGFVTHDPYHVPPAPKTFGLCGLGAITRL